MPYTPWIVHLSDICSVNARKNVPSFATCLAWRKQASECSLALLLHMRIYIVVSLQVICMCAVCTAQDHDLNQISVFSLPYQVPIQHERLVTFVRPCPLSCSLLVKASYCPSAPLGPLSSCSCVRSLNLVLGETVKVDGS
jgi:hypothetical protein